ncbi:MAG: hypothetical protein JW869_03325 [Candidatus Omnitrophica bacterium]|nr:hypothetical protein [Candidatus Omnitrophota bacterium]
MIKSLTINIGINNTVLLLFAAATAALAVLYLPAQAIFAMAGLITFLAIYLKFPKFTLFFLAVFLLFQDLIALQFSQGSLWEVMLKRAEEAILLMLFSTTVLRKAALGEKWKKSSIDLPLILLVVIAAISSFANNIVAYKVASFDLFILLKSFLIFYIFYDFPFKKEDVVKISKVFFGISVLVLLFGVVDLLAPAGFRNLINNKLFIDYRFGIPAIQSVFVHPGVFGWFMAFCACFTLAFFIILRGKGSLFLSICFSLGLLFSMRLKPVLGLAAAIFAALMLTPGAKKVRFLFVAGLIILLLASIFGDKVNMLFEDKIYSYLRAPDLSRQARNVLYATSLRIAKDFFPFGSGLGTFAGWISSLYYSPLYSQYGISTVYGLQKGGRFITDTFWPYIIAQFGFFGCVCYVWILFSIIKSVVRVFKTINDMFLRAFALGSLMILTEAIVETIASQTLLKAPQNFFIFATLGIACSLLETEKRTWVQL